MLKPLVMQIAAGSVDRPHVHEQGQLLFATSGLMRVLEAGRAWLLSPQTALWIPAGRRHEVHYRARVELRSLFLSAPLAHVLPHRVILIAVTPLLRELILEATRLDGCSSERAILILRLIIAELSAHPQAGAISMTQDAGLRTICLALLADPGDRRSLDDWAREAGMSRRSFTRRFHAAMGQGFMAWRQQVRLQEAVTRLGMGQQVTTIAYDMGYESPATFSTMFSRALGAPPSRFRLRRQDPVPPAPGAP